MRLADETVNQVRDLPDIVPVIQEYVTLKKRGRNYIGLCPFHSERTPSFTVSPEKKIFHCFGCHESGDLIAFVSRLEHLNFTETIVFLAEKHGIDVVQEEGGGGHFVPQGDREKVREILLEVREKCKLFFKESTVSQQYLKKRGLNSENIALFHLGYSPDAFNWVDYFEEKDYSKDLLFKAGLIYQSENGDVLPRFRNRLLFPISDSHSRTVGFGGRRLDDQKQAKYINSEETPHFNKRKILYGFDLAKSAIKKNNCVLVMEGYMDVITAHQFGFNYSVACMGTALTQEQVQLLKRLTSNVVLALDDDSAGQQSTERSFEILRQFDCQVKVIQLSGLDPADALQENGSEYFQKLIEDAIPMVEYKYHRALARHDKNVIENIPRIIDEVLPFLKAEKDPIVQDHYMKRIAKHLKVEPELVMAKIKKTGYNISRKLNLSTKSNKDKWVRAEEYLIFFSACSLDWRVKISEKISSTEFITAIHRKLFALIGESELVNERLVDSIEDADMKSMLSQIIMDAERKGFTEPRSNEWIDCIETVHNYSTKQRIAEIKQQLREEDINSTEVVTALLEELQMLKNNL
ncbi:DNA primase [Candidatus Marinamargulisbacteria bacterium SCGC AAA071-K20]|nr:DNA primase [Candidatus Marinamargulisbacteria bacterium SCGC AAA071-K20]